MSLPVTIAIHAAMIVSLIVIHELGHYVAGRFLGVPRDQMRIVLLSVPPHVAFAEGGAWVGPKQAERYGAILQDRFRQPRALFWFVASGLTVQTLYAVLIFVALWTTFLANFAWMGLSYSGAILLFYLGFDPVMRWITGHPSGDVTAMFASSPWRATFTLLGMLVLYAFLLFLF